jgi:hypothetical protein
MTCGSTVTLCLADPPAGPPARREDHSGGAGGSFGPRSISFSNAQGGRRVSTSHCRWGRGLRGDHWHVQEGCHVGVRRTWVVVDWCAECEACAARVQCSAAQRGHRQPGLGAGAGRLGKAFGFGPRLSGCLIS